MEDKVWRVKKEEELFEIAAEILEGNPDHKIFILDGNLGAGKTTFVKFVARYLSIAEDVSSPSFSIVNEYRNPDGLIIYHMDLYRLENLEEAMEIGITEYLDSGNYVFIEWPEIIRPLFDQQFSKIAFELLEDQTRKINFIGNPS